MTATIVTGVSRDVYNGMFIHAGEKVSPVVWPSCYRLSSEADCVFVTVCGCRVYFVNKAGPNVSIGCRVLTLPRMSLFTSPI